MSERKAQDELIEVLSNLMFGEDRISLLGQEMRNVQSFEDAALLTHNKGVEIRLQDGTTIQLSLHVKRPWGWTPPEGEDEDEE